MIDFLIIATIIALLTLSVWLYRSLEKVDTGLDIKTSLSPEASIQSFLYPPPTALQRLVKRIQKNVLQRYVLQTSPIRQYTPPTTGVEPNISGCDGGSFESLSRVVRFDGLAQVPLKVYRGDSCTITLTLNPSIRNPNLNEKPIKVYRQGDKVNLTITVSRKQKEYLEVELMAAGFSVDGEKKQRQLLLSDSLYYQWNCFFEKSGSHSFSFVFRVVDSSDKALQIGRIEQGIKVAQIDHLTQRQVWILASLAGVISGALTLAEILKNLGIW